MKHEATSARMDLSARAAVACARSKRLSKEFIEKEEADLASNKEAYRRKSKELIH